MVTSPRGDRVELARRVPQKTFRPSAPSCDQSASTQLAVSVVKSVFTDSRWAEGPDGLPVNKSRGQLSRWAWPLLALDEQPRTGFFAAAAFAEHGADAVAARRVGALGQPTARGAPWRRSVAIVAGEAKAGAALEAVFALTAGRRGRRCLGAAS